MTVAIPTSTPVPSPTPLAPETSLPTPTQSELDSPSLPEETQALPASLPTLMPITDVNGDGKIDICEAVPNAIWEAVIGRPQVSPPMPFQDDLLGEGCAFDFGQDSNAVYFAYVTFASEQQFNDALASATRPEPVTSIGDSAFLNYGADARQLWLRVGDKAAMVAIGDQENVGGMIIVAMYLIQALTSTQP